MADPLTTERRSIVRAADRIVIGPEDFGAPGLVAREPIGPTAPVRYVGEVLVLHDSVIAAGLGIGHHPHRGNERLFYVLSGGLHHDDALNHYTADAAAGDLAIFTEGHRGMIHSESNPADTDARIWIIVAPTDPMPPTASVKVLADADADRQQPTDGVAVKVVVGDGSPARIASDVRWLADIDLRGDAVYTRNLGTDEAVVVQPIAGTVRAMGEHLDTDDLLAVGADEAAGGHTLELAGTGDAARVLVAVTGSGLGFATNDRAHGR